MRTIRVTGKGGVRVKPDTTRVSMEIEGVFKSYEAAVSMSAKHTEELKDAIEKLGFDRTDLKTVSFDISTEYTNERDEHDNYKRVFVGYRYQHMVKLEFPVDNRLLGRLLYAMAHLGSFPKLDIGYLVRDTEGPKETMLRNAVADAARKAEILASAAGVKLGAIHDINYSWSEVRFETSAANDMMLMCESGNCESYDMDIEPDDIEKSDTVTVEWEIIP